MFRTLSSCFHVYLHVCAGFTCLVLYSCLQEAQARHPISVETVPHVLSFDSSTIQARQTMFKCAPPIRDPANRVSARGRFFPLESVKSRSKGKDVGVSLPTTCLF